MGNMNGYIEEMLRGQKVVKTFCHEEKAIAGFRKLQRSCSEAANNANREANIVMPVNGNISNLIYVMAAIWVLCSHRNRHSGAATRHLWR